MIHLPSFHLSTSGEEHQQGEEVELFLYLHVQKFQVPMIGPTYYKYHHPQLDVRFVLPHLL